MVVDRSRIALAICVALFAVQPAWSTVKERWIVAKASGGALAYNAETLTRDEKTGFITFASGMYLIKSQKTADGKAFHYVLSEDRLDCVANSFQAVTRVLFDDGQKVVDLIELDEQPWQPIGENPALAFLQSIACKGDAVGNTREAANVADALKLMKTLSK